MKRRYQNKMEKFKFMSPCNILLSGASQSGKSTFVLKLIESTNVMFINPPIKIYYCYKVYQSCFEKINDFVTFNQGLPDINDIADPNGKHTLIILDDLMTEVNESIVNLFVVQSHHLNISPIFILQNLFHNNKNIRTINLNAHYIVSFRQSRDSAQIGVLARQIFGKNGSEVVKIYSEAMKTPYNYVVFNIHPSNIHRASIHLYILPNESEYEIFYTE